MTGLRGRGASARVLLVALIGLAAFVSGVPARAAEAAQPAGSLKLVPENAAFYGSMLRGREQIQAIAKSRAWARLMDMPVTKMGLEAFKKEFSDEGHLAFLFKMYQMPENKQLLELLGEMFSDEVFVYGGEGWGSLTLTMHDVIGAAYFAPFTQLMAARGGVGGGAGSDAVARIILEALAKNAKNLNVPELVIGFKLKKKDGAEAQIKRLEKLLKGLSELVPQLKDAVKREKIGAASFLTLKVDGSMLPWDQIPIKSLEQKEGQFDALIAKLKALKLTLSIGVREEYLLVSMGPSNAHLKNLGKGKLLADRKEFEPLAKFAEKRLTSIGYTSQAMNQVVGTSKKSADNFVEMIKGFLPKDSLNENQLAKIDKDLKDLAKDFKRFLPDPGAVLTFSFMTERGYESYHFDRTHYPQQDGSKPLGLLNHLGGNPLLATVGRSKANAEQYQVLVKWIKIGYGYVEDYALPLLPGEAKEKYDQFTKKVFPVLKKMDTVTSTMLLPALKDGQVAFVIDAKIKSKQWIKVLPETEKEMPMIELALIVGVSDAALLRKAFSEYRLLANLFLSYCVDLAPGQLSNLKIPKPATRKIDGGDLYFYVLPEEWVDKQLAPNGAVGPKVAVVSTSPGQSQRILKSTPLKIKGGPLADTKRALASATYFNCAGMLDAVSPWIDLVVKSSGIVRMFGPVDDEQTEKVLGQVHTVVEVLKVFRSYASVTYLEDKVWVTHSESIIRDVPVGKK